MTIGVPANIVISSGGDAPVWVLEGNRFDETLSREISHQKANPVTLTLSSAAKPPQQPSRRRRVKLKNLKNPRAGGPSTFSFTTLLYNPRRQPHPFFLICGEAATTTLGAKGPVKPKNPPAARPVHLKNLPFWTIRKRPPCGGLFRMSYMQYALEGFDIVP